MTGSLWGWLLLGAAEIGWAVSVVVVVLALFSARFNARHRRHVRRFYPPGQGPSRPGGQYPRRW